MNDWDIKKHGRFLGSYGEWQWHEGTWEDLSEKRLLEIYKKCKDSWKS